jgi:hypothetical protein
MDRIAIYLPLASRHGSSAKTARGVFVFCFPIESEVGRAVQGFAGVDGKFSMQNLPPGRYLVLAFRTPNQNLEYRNEEVLRRYESKGPIVTLEAGQKGEAKVPVLTEDEE